MKVFFTFTTIIIFSITNSYAQTIIEWLKNSPEHTIFTSLVEASGLENELEQYENLTAFVPTDSAFNLLPDTLLTHYLNNDEKLKSLVRYHFIDRKIDYSIIYFYIRDYFTMLNSVNTAVSGSGNTIRINQALITKSDITATNGFIHQLDQVLSVPEYTVMDAISESPELTMIDSFLKKSTYNSILNGYGPFTIFAPTNAAFEQLLPEGIHDLKKEMAWLNLVMGNHIVKGTFLASKLYDGDTLTTLSSGEYVITNVNDTIKVNNACVTVRDLITDNGVVHVIDIVQQPKRSIMDILYDNEDINIMFHLIYGNISPREIQLTLPGNYTVFAPTDDAFHFVSTPLENFINSNNQNRLGLIDFHLLNTKILAEDMTDGQSLMTYNNKLLYVRKEGPSVWINNAKIILENLKAYNGVVHKIDNVLDIVSSIHDLIPSKLKVFPNPTADQIFIQENLSSAQARFYITDMKNQIVQQGILNNTNGIDVTQLIDGQYQIFTIDGRHVHAGLFVKF
jgi:uncharacterized surface protein with fasciclin (FAS1) repeats